VIGASQTTDQQTDAFENELRKYIHLHDDSTALEFWKEHDKEFPLLSKMAQIYSGISPGSVPVESGLAAPALCSIQGGQ